MAREKDEAAERNTETRGSIDKRREERAEISQGYREASQELPDNRDPERVVNGLLSVAQLLEKPRLARLYTFVLRERCHYRRHRW